MQEKKGLFRSLFGSKDRHASAQPQPACGCGNAAPSDERNDAPVSESVSILILGSGCQNCRTLEANARNALEQIGGTDWSIGHITDFSEIAAYGVMTTPGLVINGKVVSTGKVLSPEAIAALLQQARG